MEFCSPFAEYQLGQLLTLNVIPGNDEAHTPSIVRVKIRQLHSPRTLSCGMVVDVLDEGSVDSPLFLKMYDRRFSDQLRYDEGFEPWTPEEEQDYIESVRTGEAEQFNRDVRLGNFLVQRKEGGAYQVFMIDFGLARVRRADETDRGWAVAKIDEEEENAVGLVLKKILGNEGFEVRFEMSDRYMEYDVRDEEGELVRSP